MRDIVLFCFRNFLVTVYEFLHQLGLLAATQSSLGKIREFIGSSNLKAEVVVLTLSLDSRSLMVSLKICLSHILTLFLIFILRHVFSLRC